MNLLQIYDQEVRGALVTHPPDGWTCEQDGPLTRCLTTRDGFAMLTGDASLLPETALAALVDRTFAHFRDLGVGFEWKTFDHDRPDLRPLLVARGAVPEEHEALVLGEAEPLAREAAVPAGLSLRTVTAREDLERIAAMESQVWGEDWSWLVEDLATRVGGRDPIDVVVVEDGDLVVSAAWLVPVPGTRVAGLWGGSTLPAYRGARDLSGAGRPSGPARPGPRAPVPAGGRLRGQPSDPRAARPERDRRHGAVRLPTVSNQRLH